ncbi:MAG TPA: DUF2269 family protein [Acidimicrobiia bacterium]|jgi:uncharacterized membrane protein|nr:DUF2269 family protein [Acidimicrobiia bacterium]
MQPPHGAPEENSMLASYNSDAYNIVKVLHILCAIIGFGGVTLNGVYGAQIRARGGREAAAIGQAVYRVSVVAEYFIYAVFLLGLALVGLGSNLFDFGQTWIWLSIVLFVAALGVSHGALRPRVRRMNVLMEELAAVPATTGGPPPQAAELERLGKQVAALEAILDVTLVVILVFMVFKPGGNRI